MIFTDGDPGPEIRRKLNEMVGVWEDALISAVGPQGWSPSLAVVADGARSVLQIIDWVGGEGAKPAVTGYIGATGIVATAALAVDIRGIAGEDGPPNTLTVGVVTAGATASASITGGSPNQELNLVLPKGDAGPRGEQGIQGLQGEQGIQGLQGEQGTTGEAATITVGTVTTGSPGTSASITNSGTTSDAVFDFVIPRGDSGAGNGDVTGPGAVVDNHVVLFDGVTGKVIKDGGALGTAASQNSDAFASAAQGVKADSAVQPADLSAVAATGNYDDLFNKPTIPAAQQQTDWNAPSGVTAIANKPEVIAAGATQVEARTAIGAGTSNLVIGTTAGTAMAGDAVPFPEAPLDGKTYGRKDASWVEASGGIYKLPILSVVAMGKSPVSALEQLDFNCFYPTGLPVSNSVVACGDLFVACASSDASPDFATSPDGKVWTLRTTTDNKGKIIACDGIGVVVAKRSSGADIWVSANKGVTWVKKTSLPGSALNNSIPAIHNGIILIQASAANTLYRSTDYGTTWTTVSVPFATTATLPIVAVAGRFVVPTMSGTYSSSDGITWTAHPELPAPSAVTYSEGSLYRFATNTAGSPVVETTDGLNFSTVPDITLLVANDIPTKINGMSVGVVSGSTWHTSGPITRALVNSPRNKNIAINGSLTVYGATGGVVVIDSTNLQTGWFGD